VYCLCLIAARAQGAGSSSCSAICCLIQVNESAMSWIDVIAAGGAPAAVSPCIQKGLCRYTFDKSSCQGLAFVYALDQFATPCPLTWLQLALVTCLPCCAGISVLPCLGCGGL
jgi:hypothetical protein